MLTPGQKAARTKRRRYGEQGLSVIAAKAYRTRLQRKQERLTELQRHLARAAGAAKSRARQAKLKCEEDLAGWALATMEAQGHRCLLSGVPFSLEALGHGAAPRPPISKLAPETDLYESGLAAPHQFPPFIGGRLSV